MEQIIIKNIYIQFLTRVVCKAFHIVKQTSRFRSLKAVKKCRSAISNSHWKRKHGGTKRDYFSAYIPIKRKHATRVLCPTCQITSIPKVGLRDSVTQATNIQRCNCLVVRWVQARHCRGSFKKLVSHRIIYAIVPIFDVLISKRVIWICRFLVPTVEKQYIMAFS